MYFTSSLPTTRLSITTSALPSTPIKNAKQTTLRPSNRSNGAKSKFKGNLNGVQEEEAEEIIAIANSFNNVAGSDHDEHRELWCVLGREDLSVWYLRPKVVIAKLRRNAGSLRRHGSNASVYFDSPTSLVVTTTLGHHLLYSLFSPVRNAAKSSAYVLPGGEKEKANWPDGAGEGTAMLGLVLTADGERTETMGEGVGCSCSTSISLLVSILDPPSLCIFPLPTLALPVSKNIEQKEEKSIWNGLRPGWESKGATEFVKLTDWSWLVDNLDSDVAILDIKLINDNSSSPRPSQSFILLTSDGRVYFARYGPHPRLQSQNIPTSVSKSALRPDFIFDVKDELEEEAEREASRWHWTGVCFHEPSDLDGCYASCVDINERMGLIAIGCEEGTISVYSYASASTYLQSPEFSHLLSLRRSLNSNASGLATGRVVCMTWTSDGLALAVGWSLGYSIWSVYGRLGSWSVAGSLAEGYGVEGEKSDSFEDHFTSGVRGLFWSPSNLELFVLCPPPSTPKGKSHDEQLFVIPFVKSAVAAFHSPDNTKHAFLQMDDRLLVYRGADQPDMSVINPESDVWQHIKIPSAYIAMHHPIRFAVISPDARLIAVAGRRGLTHFNALSGRWKLFEVEKEEESIKVIGGMAWWSNVLLAGCEERGTYSIRMFSRDRPLSLHDSLGSIPLDSKPLLLSVFDSSLLVYTADNTFHHFLIRQTDSGHTRLRICGSIGFEGVVNDPTKVRGMSWLVPKSQQRFGDPADDLNVATIIFLIQGQIVLLRPRRAASEEVKYDLQVLASRIEFYWTHLASAGTKTPAGLENSLWGWNGKEVRIWMDALTIEKVKVDAERDSYEVVSESKVIELEFYPLAVLMDKGIIVGVDQETSLRKTLDFAMFRIISTTHLFIPHILRFHLDRSQHREAVLFAAHYQHLVYFAHALEILLHDVLEDEVDRQGNIGAEQNRMLPRTIEFLDHFDEALSVVVGCARKTEVAHWPLLFEVVGKPRDLFETCMTSGFLKVAASYLLVLHNLDSVDQSSKDTLRLLKAAMDAREWKLCRDLLSFLYSLDRTGEVLRAALLEGSALPSKHATPNGHSTRSSLSVATSGLPSPHEYDFDHDISSRGPGPPTSDSQQEVENQLGLGTMLQRVVEIHRSRSNSWTESE